MRSYRPQANVSLRPGIRERLLLPEPAELAHQRFVGDPEQEALLERAATVPAPGRHDEHVAAAPLELPVVDRRAAVAVDHREDGIRGGLPCRGSGAGGETRDEESHGFDMRR